MCMYDYRAEVSLCFEFEMKTIERSKRTDMNTL